LRGSGLTTACHPNPAKLQHEDRLLSLEAKRARSSWRSPTNRAFRLSTHSPHVEVRDDDHDAGGQRGPSGRRRANSTGSSRSRSTPIRQPPASDAVVVLEVILPEDRREIALGTEAPRSSSSAA
jgi:hypothetical protein